MPWRRRALADVRGEVLEFGVGTGANLEHYPASLTRLDAVEPDPYARTHARGREGLTVRYVSLEGPDAVAEESYDTVVCTFTLCSVADPAQTLDDLARVLRDGGRLHLVEHGLAPDAAVARWQRRLDPLEVRCAGGCHLTRDVLSLLDEARWRYVVRDQGYVSGPRPWSHLTWVEASPPA